MTYPCSTPGCHVVSCACGCGEPIASEDSRGRPRRFKNGHYYRGRSPSVETREKQRAAKIGKKLSKEHCQKLSQALSGDKNPAWKGGRIYDGDGYIIIHKPDHPYATKDGYVREHRLVMEQIVGRYLIPFIDDVHHINGVKDDNRPENLQLLLHNEHTALHQRNK